VDELNSKIPEEEWEENPFTRTAQPPWVKNYVVFLIDPRDASKVICSNSTAGMKAAYNDYKQRVKDMRRIRGEHVSPVVMLSPTLMQTH
jgi:hypothetical protein